MSFRKKGLLIVRQLVGQEECRFDFDNETTVYEWLNLKGSSSLILRVTRLGTDPHATSADYLEFSAPVNIEFIAED